MNIPAGILFGFVALFGWGLADFFAKPLIDSIGSYKAFFWMQLLSMIPFCILYFSLDGRFAFPLKDYGFFILISIFGVIGYYLFYESISMSSISLMSPIQSSNFVVGILLALVFLGEHLTIYQGVAIIAIFIGVSLTGLNFKNLIRFRKINLLPGVGINLVSAVCIGTHFLFLGLMVPKYGWLVPVFFFRVINVLFLLGFTAVSGKEITIKKQKSLTLKTWHLNWLFSIIIACDIAAILGFSVGITSQYVSIILPIAMSFPLLTVLLARIFYKEQLEALQIVGILILIAGISALSYFSSV